MNKLSKFFSKATQNKTVRNGALFSMFSFFNKGVGFVLLMLLANYIMPAEYGLLSLFTTVVALLGFFIDLSTRNYISIAYFQTDAEGFKRVFSTICVITLIATSAISLGAFLMRDWLCSLLNFDAMVLMFCLLTAFCTVLIEMNLNYARLQEKVVKYGILSCSFVLLNMLLALYFVIAEGRSWMGCVIAQVICNVVFLVIAVVQFLKSRLLGFSFDWTVCKTILLWSLPLIPHLASGWIRQGCDRFIVNSTHTTADVGLFSFALNLTSIIIMVGMAFNATNSVDLYKTLSSDITDDEKRATLKRKERLISYCYLLATIVITLSMAVVVPWLLPHYADAIPYFIILGVYGFAQCMYFLYCNYLFYFKHTKTLMYITFGTSLLHLALSLVLTQHSLYLTCAIYAVTFTLMTALVWWQARRVYPLHKTTNTDQSNS